MYIQIIYPLLSVCLSVCPCPCMNQHNLTDITINKIISMLILKPHARIPRIMHVHYLYFPSLIPIVVAHEEDTYDYWLGLFCRKCTRLHLIMGVFDLFLCFAARALITCGCSSSNSSIKGSKELDMWCWTGRDRQDSNNWLEDDQWLTHFVQFSGG